MNSESARRLRLGYGIFLGIFTAVIGLLFLVGAANIYYSRVGLGEAIYSRELVFARLRVLLVPAILWIVAIVGGYVLAVLFPVQPAAKRASDAAAQYRKLRARIPAGEGEEFLSVREEVAKSERVRLIVWTAAGLFCLLAAVMSLVYLCDPAHFPAVDTKAEILDLLRAVMPWVGASLVVVCGAVVFEELRARRTLPALKRLIVLGKGKPLPPPSRLAEKRTAAEAALSGEWGTAAIRIALLTLGTAFVVAGIFNGGMQDVLYKAVMICTECIGLG